MKHPDHFDRYDADELQDVDGVTCTRCGEFSLYWQDVPQADGLSTKPTLFSDATRRRHVCKIKDEFEAIK